MSTQPRTARGRVTRDRILSIATALVSTNGVANTSMDDVRLAAGVSKSQLYLYFADRDDLLRAVAQRTTDDVMEGQADALAGFATLPGIRAYLDGVVAIQVARQARGGCPIGTLAGQLAETDEGARLELAAGMSRWEHSLEAGLEAMARRGELGDGADPGVLASQTLALLQGGLLLTQLHRDPQQIRQATDGALALISSALADPPGRRTGARA